MFACTLMTVRVYNGIIIIIIPFILLKQSYRQKKKREPICRKDREIAERILETRQRQVSQLLV